MTSPDHVLLVVDEVTLTDAGDHPRRRSWVFVVPDDKLLMMSSGKLDLRARKELFRAA